MAKLPSALEFGPRPTPQASGSVIPIRSTTGTEAAPALAVAQVGQSIERESDQLFRIAKVEQEKSDTLRAEDAFNQLRDKALDLTLGEKGFVNVKGADAANRPIFKDYTAQLDEASKSIAESLTPDQRIKFQQRSAIGLREFQQNLLKHVTVERQHYEAAVFKGTVDTEINSIGAQYSDDNAFALSLQRMFTAAGQEVERKGMTTVPGAVDAEKQGVLDKAWKARLQGWAAADPAGAYATFLANSTQMTPAARLEMKNMLAGHALPAIAAAEVTRGSPVVQQLAPQPGTPVPGPIQSSPQVEKFAAAIDANARQYGVDAGVMRRQLQAESAGNPNARNNNDIRVTGSPSIGIAQFQPATAKRYGIDPTDPVQSIRGQAAYMSDLLKMFDGDYQKALAGYNWGEGNVQKAVEKHGDKWMAHAPASTQAYVRKIVSPEQRTAQPGATGNRTADYASMSAAQLLNVRTGNPVIDSMPADDKLRTMSLIHAEALRQRQEKQALLGTREQDARAAFYVNGAAENAPSAAELVDAYGPIDGMKRARALDEARQTGQTIQQVKTLPQADLQRLLTTKPAEGAGFADRQRNYELVVNAVTTVQQQRQADPVQFALATKSYGIQPLDEKTLKEPGALATELRARAAAAPNMARDYGTVPALLTKPESQAISSILKQSPVPAQKQYLAALFNGAGEVNTYKRLLQQLAPDQPVVALAGLAMVRNQQYQSNRTNGAADVADLILRGHAILNPPSKEDGGQHIGGKALVKMPEDDKMRPDWLSYVGTAFRDKEKAKDDVFQVARAIYAARTSEEGDDSGILATPRWKAAMELASGGIAQHGGQKIVLPYGMPLDTFKDQLRQRTAALAPQAVRATADELASLPMESVGDGRYVFQRGTGYVVDKDGRPLVLDFNTAPAPVQQAPAVAAGKLDVRGFAVTRGGAVTGR